MPGRGLEAIKEGQTWADQSMIIYFGTSHARLHVFEVLSTGIG